MSEIWVNSLFMVNTIVRNLQFYSQMYRNIPATVYGNHLDRLMHTFNSA